MHFFLLSMLFSDVVVVSKPGCDSLSCLLGYVTFYQILEYAFLNIISQSIIFVLSYFTITAFVLLTLLDWIYIRQIIFNILISDI